MGKSPKFLEREAYRRQRLRDGARLLPVFGAGVLLLPDLLLSDPDVARGATAQGMVYFFAVWGALILLGFALSRLLLRDLGAETRPPARPAPAPASEPAPGPAPAPAPAPAKRAP